MPTAYHRELRAGYGNPPETGEQLLEPLPPALKTATFPQGPPFESFPPPPAPNRGKERGSNHLVICDAALLGARMPEGSPRYKL